MSAGSTLIVSPDRSFCRIIDERESRPSQPRASASVISSSVRLASRIGTPISRPTWVASDTSLCASLSAKRGGSKTSGRKWSARPSKVRRRPVTPLRTAFHKVSGSPPALTPLVKDSAHAVQHGRATAARLPAHGESLAHRLLNHVAAEIVHQLGDRGRADRTDIGNLVARRIEHRTIPLEDLLVAANPDRHLARVGAGRAAAHRTV